MKRLPHPGQAQADATDLWAGAAKGNPGLLFQRFFHGYADDFNGVEPPPKREKNGGGKALFAKALIGVWRAGEKDRAAACNAYAQRMATLAQQQTLSVLGAQHPQPPLAARPFEAQGRWLTGSGISHPMEVGLAFHHTLGVPYLCGAGVKGLVHAWFDNASEEGDKTNNPQSREDLARLFGSPTQAGQLVFFDAVPTGLKNNPVKLELDVMTPHYTGWYQWDRQDEAQITSGEAVPADWHNPVPVTFFTAGGGMRLQFAIAPSLRMKGHDPAAVCADLALAWAWLEGALYWYGAGAKTAAGYGRFEAKGGGR